MMMEYKRIFSNLEKKKWACPLLTKVARNVSVQIFSNYIFQKYNMSYFLMSFK